MPQPLIRRIASAAAALLASAMVQAATVGDTAPDFQLPATRDAQSGSGVVRLSELRGQLVYLDFWASWCAPCKQSFPWMNSLQQRFGAQGLKVVAVNLDTHPDEARQFLAQVPPHFRVAFDPSGETPRQYAIKGMPSSVLIAPDGKVLAVHAGFRPEALAQLEARIEQALPGRALAANPVPTR